MWAGITSPVPSASAVPSAGADETTKTKKKKRKKTKRFAAEPNADLPQNGKEQQTMTSSQLAD